MPERSAAPDEQLQLTESARIQRGRADLVEVTITQTGHSRLPWRGRVITGRREF